MAKKSAKQKKPSVARKPRVKSKPAGKSRASLASLTTEQLAAELKRRQSELPKLEKQAAALRAELATVEARIAALSGGSAAAAPSMPKPSAKASAKNADSPRAPRRRHGQPTLAEQIVSVLQSTGAVMSPSEIGTAVQKQFAREVKPSFNVQVSSTLRTLVDEGAVAQVERAQYAAKGAAVASAN